MSKLKQTFMLENVMYGSHAVLAQISQKMAKKSLNRTDYSGSPKKVSIKNCNSDLLSTLIRSVLYVSLYPRDL